MNSKQEYSNYPSVKKKFLISSRNESLASLEKEE